MEDNLLHNEINTHYLDRAAETRILLEDLILRVENIEAVAQQKGWEL